MAFQARKDSRAFEKPTLALCELSLLLDLDLISKGFLGFSGFPPSCESNMSKFQFEEDKGLEWKQAKVIVISYSNSVIYLFIVIYNVVKLANQNYQSFPLSWQANSNLISSLKTSKKNKEINKERKTSIILAI